MTLTCLNVCADAFIKKDRGAALLTERRLLSWPARHNWSAATDGPITSNVLSLAPVVYELIDDFKRQIKSKLEQLIAVLLSEQSTGKTD